jgi:hypothetical protein
VAEGIDELAVAVAPEGVAQRHQGLGAGGHGALPYRIGVAHVEVHDDRRALEGERPAAAVVGKIVAQHEHGIADAHFGVHDPAVRAGHAGYLDGAEALAVKVERPGRAFADQVRGDGVEAFGDGAGRLFHVGSPDRLWGCC